MRHGEVDALVEAPGRASAIATSEVSGIGQGLDEQAMTYLERPLITPVSPHVYLDPSSFHGRLGRSMQVVLWASVVAISISALGYRKVLGIAPGDSEAESFWCIFPGSLRERGTEGTRSVTSDTNIGPTAAIKCMVQVCSWRRCECTSCATCPAKSSKRAWTS